jgi:hypothetical protein
MVPEPIRSHHITMASSSNFIASPLYCNTVTEKLIKGNHVTWNAQVLTVLHGARLVRHVNGTVKVPLQEIEDKEGAKTPNPAYDEWYASDQQVFLLSSLSKEVLPQVTTRVTVVGAWSKIENLFSSQNRARTVNTRLQLATTQKGNMSVAEYINKMKMLGEEMAAAGRSLEDEELIEYVLTGLNQDYDPIVSAVIARS